MMEDHWDTRQEYIKMGNELAALDYKQEQEKKEKEKALKEMQGKMSSVTYQANTMGSGSGELTPTFVPQKQEPNVSNSTNGVPQNFVRPNELSQNHGLEQSQNLGTNMGRMGFQGNPSTSNFQRPFGQNANPFQNQNRNF